MKKRGRIQIIGDMLRITENGANKTKVMYKANLSHNLLEKYLEVLLDKGLLIIADNVYYTTEKGREFIRHYQRIMCLLEESNNAYAYTKQTALGIAPT